jgi:hypothetical protein
MLLNHKYTQNCRNQTSRRYLKYISQIYISQIYLKLQRPVVQSIRNSDTFEPSIYIPQIYLKLQRSVVQSIRNSDTSETLYISNILKTAETVSPKYQKFWYSSSNASKSQIYWKLQRPDNKSIRISDTLDC